MHKNKKNAQLGKMIKQKRPRNTEIMKSTHNTETLINTSSYLVGKLMYEQ